MADFRRKEYRGSLLLVQECGPVDIVVDTDAKTVTPSLAKADSGYSVAGGGGGGLEYVIPEQTVTFSGGSATLQNLNTSELQDSETVIIKMIFQNDFTFYSLGYYGNNEIHLDQNDDYGIINTNEGVWTWENTPDNTTCTISAIRGF